MKKTAFKILFFCVFIFVSLNAAWALSPRERLEWMLKSYGELGREHPLFSRAHDVFEQVLTVSDKPANCFPKLILIQEADDPWAMCLRDGRVILTQKGLEICYRNGPESVGDARLAFVLGHELAHLAKDDFWEWAAFETVRRVGNKEAAIRKILKSPGEPENIRKNEIRADEYGLLYASMAGYDPKAVVDAGGNNFLREWVNQITGKAAYTDKNHPTPEARAKFLRLRMQDVISRLNLFHFGVRFYQLGRYGDALDFLEAFRKRFPCREVFNNIGLIHYQQAVEALAEYDRNQAHRYKFSTVLDTETRAEKLRRGAGGSKHVFKKNIREARKYFRKACEQDRSYMPARVNLASVYMMEGKYDKAVPRLNEALSLSPDDPGVLNNHALAMYLFQTDIKVDYFGQTVKELEDIAQKHPRYSHAFYNLGRIQIENGKKPEAWREYLDMESSDVYADIVREHLGIRATGKKPPSQGFSKPSPVKLGDFDDTTKRQLVGFAMSRVELENISGKYFLGNDIRVLILEGVVKLVEIPVRQRIERTELEIYGNPSRVLDNFSGTQTLVYDKFALDVRDGIVKRVTYF